MAVRSRYWRWARSARLRWDFAIPKKRRGAARCARSYGSWEFGVQLGRYGRSALLPHEEPRSGPEPPSRGRPRHRRHFVAELSLGGERGLAADRGGVCSAHDRTLRAEYRALAVAAGDPIGVSPVYFERVAKYSS